MTVLDKFRLGGRRALITGSSRGLGRAMAQAFAEAGADLVLIGREEASLRVAQQELAPLGREPAVLTADMALPAVAERTCATVLERYGPIDILVNNVGGRRENTPLAEQSLADWQRLIDLNLTSAMVCCKAFGGPMRQRRWGRVINVASISGQIVNPGMHGRHYETAKAAVVGLTRALAADWAADGVTVNAVAPGVFLTDANRQWFREQPDLHGKFAAMTPMGRLGEPEEIGPLALYLASDASSYMTGAVVTIDGGYTLW
jgi:NAD(P)-dependent dehydrogenase (short-subunit alcohol dehydrogenase family)